MPAFFLRLNIDLPKLKLYNQLTSALMSPSFPTFGSHRMRC